MCTIELVIPLFYTLLSRVIKRVWCYNMVATMDNVMKSRRKVSNWTVLEIKGLIEECV